MNWQASNRASALVIEPEGEGDPNQQQETDLAIGEVCARTGLSPRTVRYYEELGLLPGVRRKAGARRVYGTDELQRLRFIQRLKKLGLSLQEIKDLNSLYALAGSTRAMLERLDDLLSAHLEGLDGRIRELIGLRAEMSRYRSHVTRRIDELGPEAAEARDSREDPA